MGNIDYEETKELKSYLRGWVFWGIGILIILGIITSIMNYAGLFGRTTVERMVFKNSFQYKEARESELTTYEAELAQINHRLQNSDLSSDEREKLEAQKASINVLLNAAERRK